MATPAPTIVPPKTRKPRQPITTIGALSKIEKILMELSPEERAKVLAFIKA